MQTCMFILTYVCVVLEPGLLTARVGRHRMLGICIAWLAKLREVLGNYPSIANTG